MTEKTEDRFKDMPPLPFGDIKEEVKNLPDAVFNKLDREWPNHWPTEQGPQDLLAGLVRATQYTFRAILFLVADDKDPGRKPEFAIAIPPLVRSLLDTLITLVFLFDDLPKRSRWYFRAGWRELNEARGRAADLYPDDPIWTGWVERLDEGLEKMRKDFGITTSEVESAKKSLPYWPIPTQIPGVKGLAEDRKDFIEFLISAYYRELSQDAHLSWPGFLRRVGPLMSEGEELELLRQDAFQAALILLIAVLSELNAEGGLGLDPRLAFLWGILANYHWLAEALWEQRYAALLGTE